MKIALLGAVVALGSTALPWLTSSLEAIPPLLGYEDALFWVALRGLAILATVVLALQLVKVPELRETQRVVFAAAGVAYIARPILLILSMPTAGELRSAGLDIDRVFTPSWGILVSFAAGALMLVAAVMTHRSDDIRQAEERRAARAALLEDPELAAFAGPPPAPIVVPSRAAVAPAAPAPHLALVPQPSSEPRPGPAAPVEPAESVELVAPAEPAEPVAPAAPAVPTAPGVPVVVGEPTGHAAHAAPAEPTLAAQPRRSVAPPGFG